jgi:hypothetical protein
MSRSILGPNGSSAVTDFSRTVSRDFLGLKLRSLVSRYMDVLLEMRFHPIIAGRHNIVLLNGSHEHDVDAEWDLAPSI